MSLVATDLPQVASLVDAWIETSRNTKFSCTHTKSHPSWMRGLKPATDEAKMWDIFVASLVDAWIETLQPIGNYWLLGSRIPRGCVD